MSCETHPQKQPSHPVSFVALCLLLKPVSRSRIVIFCLFTAMDDDLCTLRIVKSTMTPMFEQRHPQIYQNAPQTGNSVLILFVVLMEPTIHWPHCRPL
eukprot:scaffold51735_cov15-Prasinocladus_malaysianus.AAC.1